MKDRHASNENKNKMNKATNSLISDETSNALISRTAALEILGEVLGKNQTLDNALDNNALMKKLDTRDRAFVRMLVATTLRRLGQIDTVLEKAQERPDALKTTNLRNLLRIGAAQIFFMDVPDHAAVDTAVQIAGKIDLAKHKSFVNAILRTLTREGKEWIKNQDAPRLNTPDWLLKHWVNDYGLSKAAEIAGANMQEAQLDITIKDKSKIAQWADVLKATQLSTGTLRLKENPGHITTLEGFEDGLWWIQDTAAALPATLFGNIKDQTVVDFCAAPGGKTMQLAAQGAHVIALDRSAKRLQRLKENAQRTNLMQKITIEVADAAVWTPKEAPRFILLDAPCTATGTIRRHPDMPWLKKPQDLEQLIKLQTRLLDHATKILAPGGIIIYCTCSLQKDEGENQINGILTRNPSIKRSCISPEEVGKNSEFINDHGEVRIFPHHLKAQGGIDGFFIARLQKEN